MASPDGLQKSWIRGMNRSSSSGGSKMTSLEDVLRNQPYPCFKLTYVPDILKHQLNKGMFCLYNIDKRTFEFPIVGQVEPAEELFAYLDFIGYYSVEDFRDLVLAGRYSVCCPSCKGPVTDAGMISFELEEPGTAEIDFASGDAEIFVCDLCCRPFALIPIT
jgi:hypothetical protein